MVEDCSSKPERAEGAVREGTFKIVILKVLQLLVMGQFRARVSKLLSKGPDSKYFQLCKP